MNEFIMIKEWLLKVGLIVVKKQKKKQMIQIWCWYIWKEQNWRIATVSFQFWINTKRRRQLFILFSASFQLPLSFLHSFFYLNIYSTLHFHRYFFFEWLEGRFSLIYSSQNRSKQFDLLLRRTTFSTNILIVFNIFLVEM